MCSGKGDVSVESAVAFCWEVEDWVAAARQSFVAQVKKFSVRSFMVVCWLVAGCGEVRPMGGNEMAGSDGRLDGQV